MRQFSFFYAAGGSGYIRGKQMADYLGGKHNPTSGYEDDTCIYVKIIPPDNHPKHTYYDVDDSVRATAWLKKHTDTGVIAISLTAREYLTNELKRKDIYFIPHQHINYERWIRPFNRPIKTVGIIGSKTAFQSDIEGFRHRLEKIGMELLYEPEYWDTYKTNDKQEMRLNIMDFHKKMDIQAVWRPGGFSKEQDHFRNPNKLGNAASCGIPTVSYPERAYVAEWGWNFAQASSIGQMVDLIKMFKEYPEVYKGLAQKGLIVAENYHIEKIAELYRKLP